MAVSIKIDEQLRARVQQLADSRRRSPHWIMRDAIEQYVAKEEARESFYAEARAAWAGFQETGLHLTGDEVDGWLSTWGTPQESDMPKCHD